jgi:hypothetical protein
MTALDRFTAKVRAAWGPLTSDLVGECRRQLRDLAEASPGEAWRTELRDSRPARQELCRDPDHGFVLLAHAEQAGLYRPPHDHGRAWVVYAVLEGEVEMRTFARIEDVDGVRLVQRDSAVLGPGQAQAYLPGDIHDTRCRTDNALLLRFTERDLRAEAVTRYPPATGGWTIDR